MKKRICLLAFLVPFAAEAAQLTVGQKYDFIANDGQHVYEATFIKETKTEYMVKAPAFGDEAITIEKNILSGPPRPSRESDRVERPGARWSYKWSVALSGDVQLSGGAFSSYAQLLPGVSVRASRNIARIPYLGVNALSLWMQYAPIARAPRRIDMATFAAGPRWNMRFKRLPRSDFYVMAAPALSVLRFDSFTFQAVSANIGALAVAGVDWSIGRNLFVQGSFGAHYIYDNSTFVMLYMFSAGIGYAW